MGTGVKSGISRWRPARLAPSVAAARARASAKAGDAEVYVVASRARKYCPFVVVLVQTTNWAHIKYLGTVKAPAKFSARSGSARLAVAEVAMQQVLSPGVKSMELPTRMKTQVITLHCNLVVSAKR